MSRFIRGCTEAWRLWVYLAVMLISALIVREINLHSDHIGEPNKMIRNHPIPESSQ